MIPALIVLASALVAVLTLRDRSDYVEAGRRQIQASAALRMASTLDHVQSHFRRVFSTLFFFTHASDTSTASFNGEQETSAHRDGLPYTPSTNVNRA